MYPASVLEITNKNGGLGMGHCALTYVTHSWNDDVNYHNKDKTT